MKGTHKNTWHHLYHVFPYIYSLQIKKDICDRRNISIKLLCVCVCLWSGELFIFSIRVSSLVSYFFVLSILRYFLFHVVCYLMIISVDSGIFREVIGCYKKVDILFNNAEIIDENNWEKQIDSNVVCIGE